MMTPDELERLPAPPICRSCAHWIQFTSFGVDRQMCGKLKPQHPGCKWHMPKNESLVQQDGRRT